MNPAQEASDSDFITRYYAGKCIRDPLMYPNKKEWLDCVSKFKSADIVKTSIVAGVLIIIALIVIFFAEGGLLTGLGIMAFGLVIIIASIVTYNTSISSAERDWDILEVKIRSYLPDVIDENYFNNYPTYDVNKRLEVKEKWVTAAKQIREAKNESARLRVAEDQADGAKNMGRGGLLTGVGVLADALATYKK